MNTTTQITSNSTSDDPKICIVPNNNFGTIARRYIPTTLTPDYFEDVLGDYAHEAWCGWMRDMVSKCVLNPDGTMTMPKWAVDRWARQMNTPYADLPSNEQASDIAEARKIVEVINTKLIHGNTNKGE